MLQQLSVHFLLFLLVLMLMPINWLIEVMKWRNLVIQFSTISFRLSVWSVLFGLSMSLLTPYRLGELAGRLIHIPKNQRVKVLYVNTFSSFSQLLFTALAALIIFPFYPFLKMLPFALKLSLSVLIIISLLYLFFSSHFLKRLIVFINQRLRFNQEVDQLNLKRSKRLATFLLSFLRYGIFLIQFVLLVQVFDPAVPYGIAVMACIAVFFVASVVPSAWISDLPVRSSVAYMVFEQLGYAGTVGLFSSLILWCINLLIPAFVGLVESRKVDWLAFKKVRYVD